MNVYKYRSNKKQHLKTAMNNQIFVALPTTLDDKFELKFKDKNLKNFVEISESMNIYYDEIAKKLNEIGIYSLSKDHLNIRLWLEYANQNEGFCIEYDLDLLLSFFEPKVLTCHSNVTYSKEIPELSVSDLQDNNKFYEKTMLTKYKSWSDQEEYRLVFEKSGLKKVHPKAIKAIYFGEKMAKKSSEKKKGKISQECVMNSLKGRNIKYFQVHSRNDAYELYTTEVEDLYKDSQNNILEKNEIDKKVIDSNSFRDMNITSEILEKVIDMLEDYPSKTESLYARKNEKGETIIIAILENNKVIKICAYSLKIITENQ